MGKALAFAKLDAWLEGKGEDALLALASRLGSGELPSQISASIGVPYSVLKAWIEDDPDRLAAVELAMRAGADQLEAEALQEVRDARPETVSLAKLRYESYVRSAGFRDRKRFGSRVDVEVTQTVSIVDALREARGRVVKVVEKEINPLPVQLPVPAMPETHTEI